MSAVAWAAGAPALPDERVLAAVEQALAEGGRPGIELSVVFVSDEELARLHDELLDDPSTTDVISIDLGDDGDGPAGELYVSVDRARAVAGELGASVERELLLYVVHGVLHLCGHDDLEPRAARRMRAAEARVLERLGVPLDPERHR